jgi:hypothetical protein
MPFVTPGERYKGLDEAIPACEPVYAIARADYPDGGSPVTKLGARGPGVARPGKRLRQA